MARALVLAVPAIVPTHGLPDEREQREFARRVMSDLSLTLDGGRLKPRLISASFPAVETMKEGLGEIRIDFAAEVPSGGAERGLVLGNRHLSPIAAYLVNCLVPEDPEIRIKAQRRNYEQSRHELEYVESGAPLSAWLRPDGGGWLGTVAIVVLARAALLWRRRRRRREAYATRNFATASSSRSMPSPGSCGTSR